MALACLVASIYQTQLLLPLLKNGMRTEAIVVDIHRGAKGSKFAIYQFDTETDQQVTSRDNFQMYFIRLDKGEQVTVIYDPNDTNIITADLGLWNWQSTTIFLFGFVFLAILGLLILRYKPKQT